MGRCNFFFQAHNDLLSIFWEYQSGTHGSDLDDFSEIRNRLNFASSFQFTFDHGGSESAFKISERLLYSPKATAESKTRKLTRKII